MTKTEFKYDAGKAGIPAELYGATLTGELYGKNGSVSGGKVIGIVWKDEWQTRTEYSPGWLGLHEVTSLGKAPYVILRKDRMNYEIPAWRVEQYVNEKFSAWLNAQVKAKTQI